MKLQFVEYLEQEQRIALVAAIVRRMVDMDLLVEDARKEEAAQLALRIVGSTDMASENQWAMANAVIAVAGKVAEKVATITSGRVASNTSKIAEHAGRVAHQFPRSSGRRYTAAVGAGNSGTLITREEVNSND